MRTLILLLVVLVILVVATTAMACVDFSSKVKLADVKMSDGHCDITMVSAEGETCGFNGPFIYLKFLMDAYHTTRLVGLEDVFESFNRKIRAEEKKISPHDYALTEMQLAFCLGYLPNLEQSTYFPEVAKAKDASKLNKLLAELADGYQKWGKEAGRKMEMSYDTKSRVLTTTFEEENVIASTFYGRKVMRSVTRQSKVLSSAPYFKWVEK